MKTQLRIQEMFNSYLINWRLFIARNVPREMRDTRTLSWIYCLIYPIIQLHDAFLAFREDQLFRVQFRCSVIYIEKALNDKFNSGLPAYTSGVPTGIYIDHPADRIINPYLYRTEEETDGLFIYRSEESIPTEEEVYLYRSEEYTEFVSYIIYVPFSLVDFSLNTSYTNTVLQQITALANLYRPSAKHFKILNY